MSDPTIPNSMHPTSEAVDKQFIEATRAKIRDSRKLTQFDEGIAILEKAPEAFKQAKDAKDTRHQDSAVDGFGAHFVKAQRSIRLALRGVVETSEVEEIARRISGMYEVSSGYTKSKPTQTQR